LEPKTAEIEKFYFYKKYRYLNIAQIWPVADIGAHLVMQQAEVGPALEYKKDVFMVQEMQLTWYL